MKALKTPEAMDDAPLAGREALAAAIADANVIRADLANVESAIRLAHANKLAAVRRLDGLEAKMKAAPVDVGERFMTALAAGGDVGLDVLDDPKTEDPAEVRREWDRWAQVETACRKTAEGVASRLYFAELRVTECVDHLFFAEDFVSSVIEAAERAQAQLVDLRVFLRFFERSGLIADEAVTKRVKALLDDRDLPTSRAHGEWRKFDEHPLHRTWAMARERMKVDANAPFPLSAIPATSAT